MLSFEDKFNSLTPTQQEAVRKKAQEAVNTNKIASHIQNNFSTTPKQATNNTNNGISNSSNNVGTLNNGVPKQNNNGTNNNYSSTPNYSTPKQVTASYNSTANYFETKTPKRTNQSTMGANYQPAGIPGVNIPNISPKIPKQDNNILGGGQKINTGLKTPKINTGIQTHDIKLSNNLDDFGIDKSKKKFQMTDIQKDQRDYMDLIKKKRDTEGFPKNAPRTGAIGIFEHPNWRGGTVQMTEEEMDNMPSSMNAQEKEKLKFMLNQKTTGNFDTHWNKIKDEVDNLPKEVEGLTREKFNKLNDEDK